MNLILAWVIFYSVIYYQNFRIIYPSLEPAVYIGFLEKGFPAEQAGIKVGDKILKVDGKDIKEFDMARNFIKEKKEKSVTITLSDLNGKDIRQITVTPRKVEKEDYLIGVGFSPIGIKEYKTLPEKIFSGISYSFDLTKLTFIGLGQTLRNLAFGNIK